MPSPMRLTLSLAGPDLFALARLLAGRVDGGAPPTDVRVDMRREPASPDWLDRWCGGFRRTLATFYGGGTDNYLIVQRAQVVQASFPFPRDAGTVAELLTGLPFTVATLAPLYAEWDERDPPDCPPRFGNQHFALGWGCAFRGPGHDHLVSRRWLEYGPWRLVRGTADVSLVQFHDLSADAEAADRQARPGHLRMGVTDTGGYMRGDYVYEYPPTGLYDARQQRLKIVVHGRDVSQPEMTDACAARRDQALGPDKPLGRVAYIFLEEARARTHLHELWLRELECWTITDGLEVNLTAEYNPVPVKPAWVD